MPKQSIINNDDFGQPISCEIHTQKELRAHLPL